jgi:hypothetical protein
MLIREIESEWVELMTITNSGIVLLVGMEFPRKGSQVHRYCLLIGKITPKKDVCLTST